MNYLIIKSICFILILFFTGCLVSKDTLPIDSKCLDKKYLSKIDFIQPNFEPFNLPNATSILESLNLCTKNITESNEIEICDHKKFRIFCFQEINKLNAEILIIETNSTHYAGSGGNRIFVYRKIADSFQLLNEFQGNVEGILRIGSDYPYFIFSFRDFKIGSVKILFQLNNDSYIPTKIVAVKDEFVTIEDCDMHFDRYITNFKW